MFFRFELYSDGETVDRVVDATQPVRLMARARRLLQRCRACDEIRVYVGGRLVLNLRKAPSGRIDTVMDATPQPDLRSA